MWVVAVAAVAASELQADDGAEGGHDGDGDGRSHYDHLERERTAGEEKPGVVLVGLVPTSRVR